MSLNEKTDLRALNPRHLDLVLLVSNVYPFDFDHEMEVDSNVLAVFDRFVETRKERGLILEVVAPSVNYLFSAYEAIILYPHVFIHNVRLKIGAYRLGLEVPSMKIIKKPREGNYIISRMISSVHVGAESISKELKKEGRHYEIYSDWIKSQIKPV